MNPVPRLRTRDEFLAALERSFLPRAEKDRLKEAARSGVTPELWNRFNDVLIEEIVRRQKDQRRFVQGLDGEIDRFTKHYEEEKTRLDIELRDELEALGKEDREGRERLWAEYRKTIAKLQRRLLREVERTSSTILQDVVRVTIGEGN